MRLNFPYENWLLAHLKERREKNKQTYLHNNHFDNKFPLDSSPLSIDSKKENKTKRKKRKFSIVNSLFFNVYFLSKPIIEEKTKIHKIKLKLKPA